MSRRAALLVLLVICVACERRPRGSSEPAAFEAPADSDDSLPPHGFQCPEGTTLLEGGGGIVPSPNEDPDKQSTGYWCFAESAPPETSFRGRHIAVADDGGQLLKESFYDDQGRKHGTVRYWSWDGVLIVEGTYVDGLLQGTHRYWHDNGVLRQSSTYVDGKLHGETSMWSRSGTLRAQGPYVDGKRHGKWTAWHENGNKHSEGTYVAGEKADDWRYWDEDGNPAEGP